ncbi:MAG TPA: CHAD domain-containing protein, partial [Candidatus Polarisedimenticolia bacterium]|nr:CHAD domain-containing protein [Candidatus Polarisedimenticolia bacterium]
MADLKSRAAGLSPARLLALRCAEVMRQRRRVRRRGDPDSVHDLRVATRRLNEALDFHAEWLPARPRRRLARRARRIRRALGPLRDADVLVELVGVLMRKSGPDDRARLAVLARVLEEQADGLRRKGGVRVPGVRRRAGELMEALRDGAPVGVRARGAELLAARMPSLREALAAARAGKPDALHRLRIAIKRYRYTLEILDGAGVRPARAAVARAEAPGGSRVVLLENLRFHA